MPIARFFRAGIIMIILFMGFSQIRCCCWAKAHFFYFAFFPRAQARGNAAMKPKAFHICHGRTDYISVHPWRFTKMQSAIHYIYLLSTVFIWSCSTSNEKKCSKLKRGEFFYKSSETFNGSSIVRNDSVQLVTDQKTGETTKQKVLWVEPCTYVLYPFPGDKPEILNSDLFPIKVSILEITKKYYTVHVTSWDRKSDFEDTAWIVKLVGKTGSQ